MLRRKLLTRDRYECILLQRRHEDLSARLQSLETLGEGRTTADYEALRVAYVNYRDKLDERDRELEKLRYKYVDTRDTAAEKLPRGCCTITISHSPYRVASLFSPLKRSLSYYFEIIDKDRCVWCFNLCAGDILYGLHYWFM